MDQSLKRKYPDNNNNDGPAPMDIDMQVDVVAQAKLVNGIVSKTFDEKLEDEYGSEWKEEKSASKIHMIPCVFISKRTKDSRNGREAERALYNVLERINTDHKSQITYYSGKTFGFVFHNLTFDDEEIDFIFLTTYGLLIMECKGAINRKRAQPEYEEACNQLNRQTTKLFDSLCLSSDIPILKVVAFPLLTRCDIEPVNETRVLFKEDLNDLNNFLRRSGFLVRKNAMRFEKYVEIAKEFLVKYHSHGKRFVNCREFKRRGISDCTNSLQRTFKTKFYTKEQAMLLNVDHCEYVWVTGPAGTGKTLVLKDLVEKLAERYVYEDSKKILAITYNRPVNKDIEQWVKTNTKHNGKLVSVKTFSKLLWDILPANTRHREQMEDEEKIEYILKNAYLITTQYRHILVDEAQDLPGNWLSLLYAMLEECEESNMWIFEDPFQVVRRNTTRQGNGNFTKYSLTKVFRNTHNVFEAYQHCYRSLREQVTATEESFSEEELSQPCIDHDVYGLSPHYIRGENDDQLGDALVSTIKVLLNERVPFSDVAVVTCSTEVNHVCKVLENENIMWKDADGRRTSKQNKDNHPPVIVDSYQRFKGLEVKVLIFFIPSGWEPRPMDIYVGFSRSFCHLVVIGNSRMINKIKEDQGD